jgi:SpoVK/Ycf46/Vps4 family AAA+-type ATPase
MAKADQIIQLLKSHIDGDEERFYAIAMQVAAHEAHQGHDKIARELKELIDLAKSAQSAITKRGSVISLATPKGELANLLSVEYPSKSLAELTFSESLMASFKRIILEQRQQKKLKERGFKPRRKILLYGPPGTGKTVTASALAKELSLPLFTIRLDGLITKYMGETAAKLRQIFDAIMLTRGVYLFDEFDAIGGDRNAGNDVGEIRRVLNSFLHFFEKDCSDSLIIAATNFVKLLDNALFRRFDDVIEYSLPSREQTINILKNRLHDFKSSHILWDAIASVAKNLSQAEITKAADEAAKIAILNNSDLISEESLAEAITERQLKHTISRDQM